MIKDFGAKKPKIDYPCVWEYTIFLALEIDAKDFVSSLLGAREYKLEASRKNTKYQSYKLATLVLSQNERLEIFNILKENCAFVL